MRPFINFKKNDPELFRHPDISISLKLPDKTSPNISYKNFLKETNVWLKEMFVYLMSTSIKNVETDDVMREKFAQAMLPTNLAKLFDDLDIRTWSVDNLPQPTDVETKTDIIKSFLFALNKNQYIVHAVLKKYFKEDKEKDYVFLFQKFLDERGEEKYLEHYLTPECDVEKDQDGNYRAEAFFEDIAECGFGATKQEARQTACKLFLQQWATK